MAIIRGLRKGLMYSLLLLLCISNICYAGAPLEDEFGGSSLSDSWTEYGSGSIAVNSGYLEITTVTGSYTGIKQTNITGDFDIYARIGGSNNVEGSPPDSPSATDHIKIFAYVTNEQDEAEIYQGYDTTAGKNEHHGVQYILGQPWGGNVELDASEYWCYRVARASDIFSVYYNAAQDCSGGWTEIWNSYRLDDSSAVTIGLEAKNDGIVYKADFFRCIGTCSSVGVPSSISGVSF